MKVAIYCRLSEEDKNKQSSIEDSESIQNQKSMLLQYAMDRGWNVHGIYSDDDYAGADRNRPEWNKMLVDAEQRKFDIVLCKTQSRFTREIEMVEKYLHDLFPRWGIRFIGAVDNADTDNKGNKKSRQINGLVNEWYLEDMSESVKSALTTRRKQGYHIGAFAVYGYKKDPNNKGKLLVDDEAAAVVKEVFELFASGMGKTAICRLLNDRGVPNPTKYKLLKGIRHKTPKKKAGTQWKYFRISDMLADEVYIGNMVQGKYGSVSYKTGQNKPRPKEMWIRVENTHEPIINRELWDRVQALIAKKSRPWGTGEIGLFAGKTKCMFCDYIMRACKKQQYRYLRCTTRYFSSDMCEGGFISLKELENAVLDELNSMLDDNLDSETVERGVRLLDNLDERISKLQDTRVAYSKKLVENSKALKTIYIDKVNGIITETQFVEFSRDFAKTNGRLEESIKDVDIAIAGLESKRSVANDRSKIVEAYSSVESLDRIMVEKLIDYIRIGKRDEATRQVPIEIHWNF